MKHTHFFPVFVLLAFNAACLASRGPYFQLGQDLPADFAAAANRTDASAVVLLDHQRLELSSQGPQSTTLDVHRAVLIRDREGLEHAQLMLPSDGSVLSDFQGVTILPDGRRVPVASDSIGDMLLSRLGGTKSEGRWAKMVAFPEVTPGSVIEYRYRVRWSHWLFFWSHALDPNIPARNAKVEVVVPHELELKRRAQKYDSVASTEGGMSTYTWTLRSYEPRRWVHFDVDRGVGAPSIELLISGAKLYGRYQMQQIILFQDWGMTGAMLWKRYSASVETPPDSLISGLKVAEPQNNAEEVYRRVQTKLDDRSRLIETEDERDVAAIWKSGYATSEERALVMFSALRASKVTASLVLVGDAAYPVIEQGFPTPSWWNRSLLVAVQGPEGLIYLDPDCYGCRAGQLAPEHRGRSAMLIQPTLRAVERTGATIGFDGELYEPITSLVTTPEHDGKAALFSARYELALTERGLTAKKGRLALRGDDAASRRAWYADNPLRTEEVQDRDRVKYLDGVEGGTVRVARIAASSEPLEYEYSNVLIARDGFVRAGEWTLLPIDGIFRQSWMDSFRGERTTPVQFREAPSYDLEAVFELPRGATLISAPESGAVRSPLGEYVLDVTRDERSVTVRERISIARTEIAVADYAEFQRFLAQVAEHRRAAMVIKTRML